ncbi:hypothetical protein [Hallella seregens]|uniref:Uncharacterized protein n=1 Tax=Hallella seregens ATCC 51272 TaxID=1336250 RepID=A0ABV5ZMY6_9BACT|nr:hypothetical protein [Hallella seregens]
MKKILLSILTGLVATAALTTSCRMAPSQQLGDTVEAHVFEPMDTTLARRTQMQDTATVPVKDSLDIFYIGSESNKTTVQLVSYPSRRDTAVYGKGRHIKVSGNADFDHIVRARFWVSPGGDSLVTRLEEVVPTSDQP